MVDNKCSEDDLLEDYPPFMTTKQVAACGIKSVNGLNADRSLGVGLPFIKIGNVVRYRKSDVIAYVNSHVFTSTAEAKVAS